MLWNQARIQCTHPRPYIIGSGTVFGIWCDLVSTSAVIHLFLKGSMHLTMEGKGIYNGVEVQVGGIIFNISRFSLNDRIQTDWSLFVDIIKPDRVRQKSFSCLVGFFFLIRVEHRLYKKSAADTKVWSNHWLTQWNSPICSVKKRNVSKNRPGTEESTSALNKIILWQSNPTFCCKSVVVWLLSYLGMNLLVFLQDIPVTERGCAR